MILHALLNATEPLDGAETPDALELRALASILGQSLLERQGQNAIAVGAKKILIRVSHIAPELLQISDRLRNRDVQVEFVRTIAEIAAHVAPADRVLVVADGLYASQSHYAAVAKVSGGNGAVMATTESSFTRALERIDAQHRWAGLALLNGAWLPALADMPDDWDASSILLRHAVQSGAQRLPCEAALFDQGQMMVVSTKVMAHDMENALLGTTVAQAQGTAQSLLWAPLAQLVGAPLVRGRMAVQYYWAAALLLILFGAAAAFAGAITMGCTLAIFASLLAAFARHIAIFRVQNRTDAVLGSTVRIASLSLVSAIGFSAYMHGPYPIILAGVTTAIALLNGLGGHIITLQKKAILRPWLLLDSDAIFVIFALGTITSQLEIAAVFALLLTIGGLAMWLDREFKN
jgi:hypothetical protein